MKNYDFFLLFICFFFSSTPTQPSPHNWPGARQSGGLKAGREQGYLERNNDNNLSVSYLSDTVLINVLHESNKCFTFYSLQQLEVILYYLYFTNEEMEAK